MRIYLFANCTFRQKITIFKFASSTSGHLCGGTLLTLSQENTGLWPLTAHCIDGSRTVGHDKPTVDGWKTWTEEWTCITLSNALVGRRASHRVGVTRAVGHTFSAVPGSVMWAVEWTRVSLRNTAVRLLASNNGVDVTRAGPRPFHAVHGWERRARRCWHSEGSGEKGEEEHASRRDILRLTLRNDPVFSAPLTRIYTCKPHMTYLLPSL